MFLSLTTGQDWFLCPWFPWIKIVTKGGEPGISHRYNTLPITVLFKNTRIPKLKNQLTFAFFAAINHLRGPLRKQKFTSTGSKGHGLWLVIGDWWLVNFDLCGVFQGSLLVTVIRIDGGEKAAFDFHCFCVFEKCSKYCIYWELEIFETALVSWKHS